MEKGDEMSGNDARSLPLRRKGTVTIPQDVRERLGLHEGDSLLVRVEDDEIVLTPAAVIPRDQAWFWSEEWQTREAEADEQIARGEGDVYVSDEEFLASFDAEMD
jgi:AbrB family looped-hinge helix DNA binding protein